MVGHLIAHGLVLLLLGVVLLVTCRRRPRVARGVALGALVVGVPLQLALLRWPHVLALSGWADVVLWSELWVHLALVLGLSGTLAQPAGGARTRTAVLGAALLTVAALATTWPPLTPPALGPGRVDPQGVVRQTAGSSCAAAAAATLLRRLGVDPQASERTLAARCLTDPRRGTRDLGLYRGLRLSAPGRAVRFAHPDLAGLRALARPCLVFVGLRPGCTPDPHLYALLRDRCGWSEGELHAVVFRGFAPGGGGEEPEVALIDDPRCGFERWGRSHFAALYAGQALLLE